MLNVLVRNWWTLALRGLLAVAFGIMAFVWPRITLSTLIILFAAYALSDGVFALVGAVQRRGRSGMLLLEGLVGIGAGFVTLVWPGITAFALLYLIAAWALVTGALEIVAAVQLRKVIEGEFWLALSGAASIAFGLMLMLRPNVGVLAVVWLIGSYALIFGVSLIALGFRLRALRGRSDQGVSPLTGLRSGEAHA